MKSMKQFVKRQLLQWNFEIFVPRQRHQCDIYIYIQYILSDDFVNKVAVASYDRMCRPIYRVRQKMLPPPWGFLIIFPKRLRIFKQNFTRLLSIQIYANLQNLIQLSPTLTKLCRIKRDHPPNFYISQHFHHEFYWLTINNRFKTEIIDILWTSEMPDALRPTHGSQVGWGRVNLVAIGNLRWSRYSLPSTSPASDGPCAQERRLAEIRIQMEATVCNRQRALAADFRRNMPHSPKAKDHSRTEKCVAADMGRLATDNDQ